MTIVVDFAVDGLEQAAGPVARVKTQCHGRDDFEVVSGVRNAYVTSFYVGRRAFFRPKYSKYTMLK
jgi:hypothetical protein